MATLTERRYKGGLLQHDPNCFFRVFRLASFGAEFAAAV